MAANLARVGVKINLQAETKGTYFPKILKRDTSFYLLGWTPGTYDSHNALNALMRCVDDKGSGQFNLGAYCNPKLDELTVQIQSETDKAKRDALIKQAFKLHADDIGHLPLHQQALAWGVASNVTLVADGRQLHAVPLHVRQVEAPLRRLRRLPPGGGTHAGAGGAGPSRALGWRSSHSIALLGIHVDLSSAPLVRQRCRPQLSHLAHRHRGGGDRVHLRLLRGVCALGGAAQPV